MKEKNVTNVKNYIIAINIIFYHKEFLARVIQSFYVKIAMMNFTDIWDINIYEQ